MVELRGVDWLENAVRYIQEDKQEQFRWQMLVMPLAMTPGDEKSARAMRTYQEKLERALQVMTPWAQDKRQNSLVSDEMRQKIGSGNVVVTFDPGEDKNLEIWKEARVLKE